MEHVSSSFGGGAPLLGDFSIGADLVPAQVVIWLAAARGNITDPANATDLTQAFGVVISAAHGFSLTYNTTQGGTTGVATIVYDPMAIIRSRIVPSSTAGTAYANGDGYFLTEDSGDALGITVTDGQVGGSTNDADDGTIFALEGANAFSQSHPDSERVIATQTANTTVTVTVPWINDIAIGDTFIHSQYGPGIRGLDMTSDFTESDGSTAGGGAGEAMTIRVYVRTKAGDGATLAAPILEHDIKFYDHVFNPIV